VTDDVEISFLDSAEGGSWVRSGMLFCCGGRREGFLGGCHIYYSETHCSVSGGMTVRREKGHLKFWSEE
jgi:hypothetical protein